MVDEDTNEWPFCLQLCDQPMIESRIIGLLIKNRINELI